MLLRAHYFLAMEMVIYCVVHLTRKEEGQEMQPKTATAGSVVIFLSVLYSVHLFTQLRAYWKCSSVFSPFFFFIVYFIYLLVCMCVGVWWGVQVPAEARKECQSPGAGITAGCEPPKMGAKNQTEVLFKSKCSCMLSHLFSRSLFLLT